SPGQPWRLCASAAKRSRKPSSRGWPQLRLRESRITCQSRPLIGRATAPARQPRAYDPIARAASGAGPGAAPNSSFAGGSLAGGSLTGVSSAAGSFDVVLAFSVLAAARRLAAVVCLWVPNYSLQRFDGDGAIDRTMSGSARKTEGPPPRPYTVRLTQSGHRQASGG